MLRFSLIKRGLAKLRGIPRLMMQPEFTSACNFRCSMCPHTAYQLDTSQGNRFDRQKGFMPEEFFGIFLENAQRYAHAVTVGFFGEPMLHPKFTSFVTALSRRPPYHVAINSNWSLATREKMEALRGFDCVRISIDASCAEVYERVRPGDAFVDLDGRLRRDRYECLVDKINYWLDLSWHPRTMLVFVVSSANKYDQQPFVDQWLPKLGPQDCVAVKKVLSYGGVMRDPEMQDNPCSIPDEHRVTVAWNGDCSPCNLDVNIDLCFGNLFETRDLGVLLNSPRYQEIIAGIRGKAGICGNCFDANNHTENITYAGTRPSTVGVG